ncbi:MAG TPA: hypothetical protein VN622_07710 [Clostridia bacterium]|nr:hypothetical protein [Clostridia bacterium]
MRRILCALLFVFSLTAQVPLGLEGRAQKTLHRGPSPSGAIFKKHPGASELEEKRGLGAMHFRVSQNGSERVAMFGRHLTYKDEDRKWKRRRRLLGRDRKWSDPVSAQ